MSETGVCFFAYNNDQIDYVRLATLASLYVKKYMKHNTTCLITREGDWAWAEQSLGVELMDSAFDDVVFTNDEHKENIRTHHDSPWTKFKAPFLNSNKHKVFQYTPYEKTILMDIDYIVQNNSLDYVFDTNNHVTMFQQARNLKQERPYLYERFLEPTGVPMWWSTVVYFDKSDTSEMFFDMWEHVADNWEFYKFLYNFPGQMFRTDYCVSIATHIMNGFANGSGVIDEFISGPMIYMDQKDDIIECKSADDWIYLVNDRKENWKNILTRMEKTNTHVMNKRALDRHFQALMEHVQK